MNQKHRFPAFLSLVIPGLGQLVKGDTAKGIGIIAMTIVVAPLGAASASPLLVIGMVVGWLWQVIDAYDLEAAVEDFKAWRKNHGA